jgi:hypothetical protein
MWRVYPGAPGYPGFLATQTQTKGILQVFMDWHPYLKYFDVKTFSRITYRQETSHCIARQILMLAALKVHKIDFFWL